MRPIETDKIFHLAIDTYTCLWGGIIAPRLCLNELNAKIGDTDLLLSMESSCMEETHLSKSNYFKISLSDEKSTEVASIASCMMVIFAYENIKDLTNFHKIENIEIIKFLRHLRNAAAHGNRFHFINSRSKKIIDPGIVIWRTKTIDKSLHDQKAFPNFFPHGDFPYLFEDITKILKQH